MVVYEAGIGDQVPGAGPSGKSGPGITVPFLTTSASKLLVGPACWLLGWSIEESTGLAGAMVELFDGQDTTGAQAAAIAITRAPDQVAAQSPLSITQSGGNAIQTATITPPAGQFAYLTNLAILGLGATGATEVNATLTGGQGGTITIPVSVPAGATTPITPFQQSWGAQGLQGATAGGAITATLPAFGAGNTLEEVSLQGYSRTAIRAAETEWLGYPGLFMRMGVFMNLVTGSVKGNIWIRY